MKRCLALLLAVLLLTTVWAVSVTAEPLPQNTMVAAAVQEIGNTVGQDTAGAAVVLITAENTLMTEGFGYADLTAGRLITPETVFEIGDISAVFVAVSAYALAEDGALDLQADIRPYLPEAFVSALGLSYATSTEQLLLGCAGFEGRTFDLRFESDAYCFDTLEQALLAQVPRQIAEPGSFYAPSPFSVALAAYVIECVSGVSYEAYAQREILTPLGLNRTVLAPTAATVTGDVALGYISAGDGNFSAAATGGRSYAGLYPANGALSSAADLARVMELLLRGNEAVLSEASRAKLTQTHFAKGEFTLSAPCLAVQGGCTGVQTTTHHFGAALWLDPVRGTGALTLTNTASSALNALPARLLDAENRVTAVQGGELPEIDLFGGYYALANSESASLVGRLLRRENGVEAVVGADGTLTFLGQRLKQTTPGVFVRADGTDGTVVLQFLLNAEGEVTQAIAADGTVYLPMTTWEKGSVADFLYGALLICSVAFVLAGLYALWRYRALCRERRRRYEEDEPDVRNPGAAAGVYTAPLCLAALLALCALLQVAVAVLFGSSAFYSFFGAVSILSLLICIAVVGAFVLAFMASLTRRGMTRRVVVAASLFLGYLVL